MTGPSRVSWHSFNLRSCRRGQRLGTQQAGSFSRILCTPTETELAVRIWDNDRPIPGQVDGWDAATRPGQVMLVAIDDDTEEPLWAGLVYRRRSTSGPWVSVNLISLEGYLDRRYVNDQTYSLTSQTLVAEGVVSSVATDGVPFAIDAETSIRLRDREYFDDEDKTALAVLTELAGVENGLEFTVDLQWSDATHTILEPVLRLADRIGTGVARPAATFALPGNVRDFEYVEDYSADNGATAVRAVSSGEGDSRPESSWWTIENLETSGWARFERNFTPSTSIADKPTLDLHARSELQQVWDGLNELTLEANLDTAPQPGTDWWLGDDVAVTLTCPRFPERPGVDGDVVPGYQAVVRAIGWEIDLDARTLRPRLLEANPIDVEEL